MSSAEEISGTALIFDGDLACAPSRAMGRIIVAWQGSEFGARLYLRDGTEIVIWDERPNRPPCRSSGRVESEQQIDWVPADVAISLSEQICAIVETAFGNVGDMPDAAFSAAIKKLTLFVSGQRPILGYEIDQPPRKRPRISQKILDGGEDMTR